MNGESIEGIWTIVDVERALLKAQQEQQNLLAQDLTAPEKLAPAAPTMLARIQEFVSRLSVSSEQRSRPATR